MPRKRSFLSWNSVLCKETVATWLENACEWGPAVCLHSWLYGVPLGHRAEELMPQMGLFCPGFGSHFSCLWVHQKRAKAISTHIIFQVALFPCTCHYDNLLLWVIMKHQWNDVYPIDQYWNIYFQIEAFYHEAIRFQSKTVVLRMGGGSNPGLPPSARGKPSEPWGLDVFFSQNAED